MNTYKKLTQALALIFLSPSVASAGALDSFIDKSTLYLTASKQAAETCLQPPVIKTDIVKRSPELTKAKPQNLSGLRSTNGELQGLANMFYGFQLGFTLERISSSEGYCVRVAEMTILSGQETPKIWMNPRLKQGSCQYGVTYEHELEHVQNYHDHLDSFKAAVLKELPIMLKGQAYYQISSLDESKRAEKRLETEMLALIQKLHDRSYDKASMKDEMMDSHSEYLRLSQVCRNR